MCLWGASVLPKTPPRVPGGSPGGLGDALFGALGSFRAALGGSRGTLRGHFWRTGGIAKSFVFLHQIVHFAS